MKYVRDESPSLTSSVDPVTAHKQICDPHAWLDNGVIRNDSGLYIRPSLEAKWFVGMHHIPTQT